MVYAWGGGVRATPVGICMQWGLAAGWMLNWAGHGVELMMVGLSGWE